MIPEEYELSRDEIDELSRLLSVFGRSHTAKVILRRRTTDGILTFRYPRGSHWYTVLPQEKSISGLSSRKP